MPFSVRPKDSLLWLGRWLSQQIKCLLDKPLNLDAQHLHKKQYVVTPICNFRVRGRDRKIPPGLLGSQSSLNSKGEVLSRKIKMGAFEEVMSALLAGLHMCLRVNKHGYTCIYNPHKEPLVYLRDI